MRKTICKNLPIKPAKMDAHTFHQVLRKLTSDTKALSELPYAATTSEFTDAAWKYQEYSTLNSTTMSRSVMKMHMHTLIRNASGLSPIKNKFGYVKRILDDAFLLPAAKSEFLDAFCKAQRTYSAMSRFAFMFRWKKAPYRIVNDLILNAISETQHNVIAILQNNNKYLFTILDLKNILETSLSNSPYFFAEPLVTKNPYNNMPFDKGTLYTIYFKMKRGYSVMSPLFHQYFLANFNLCQFRAENSVLIRKTHIDKYVRNTDANTLRDECIRMLQSFTCTKKIRIHDDFPSEKLVDIFRPYLRLYYTYYYTLDINARTTSLSLLKGNLLRFAEFNPKFGRKYVARSSDKKLVVHFNDKHVDFSKTRYERNFEKSHLEVDPEDYDDQVDSESESESDDDNMSIEEEGQEVEVEVERVWRIGAPIPVRIHGN